MLKLPSKTKYKKMHRHTIRDLKLKNLKLFNNCATIFSTQKSYCTMKQILDLRIFIRKSFRKKIKILIPLVVNYHKSQKGLGMRMGKGKGKGKEWFIGLTYGSIVFQLIASKRNFSKIRDILKFIQKKLSFETKVQTYEKNLQETYSY
jgi:large subunit ribosomal protein L16